MAAKNDYLAIRKSGGDSLFWSKNDIITKTPIEKEIIKQFTKAKAFRELFKQK